MRVFPTDRASARQEIYDLSQELHQRNKALKKKGEAFPDVDQRLAEVDEIIESYLNATGEVPQPIILYHLANYLLVDILADQYKHHRKDEFPIQSKRQVKDRAKRHGQVQYYDDITDKWREAK